MNPELARRNLRFGWALFVLFWLIFAGTILVAVLYLQLDQSVAQDRIPLAQAPVASRWSDRPSRSAGSERR